MWSTIVSRIFWIPLLIVSIGIMVTVHGQSPKVLRSRQIGLEGQVLSRILSEYDPQTRPPVRDSADHSAIVVIASIFINRILWHDHQAVVDLYLRQQWEDGRLVYELDDRDGIEEVVVPHNRHIWIPDTYFSNGHDVNHEKLHRTVVEPTGYVRSSEMRTVTVPVEYGSKYPFENTRMIKLRLSSYKYPIEDIVYLWANSPPTVIPVEVSQELLTGFYEFKEAVAEDCAGNYTIGIYSCIDVLITFTGASSEAFWRIFIPSILLILVSWLHFWVHGSWSVPRTISAAVPFFIFVSILIFYPQPNLTTYGVSSLQIWLFFCLIFTFASLVEYFIVICCGIRRTIRYRDGKAMKDDESPLTVTRETVEVAYDTKCANFKHNHGIDLVSRMAFPIIFLLFLIIFFIFYLV
ncbi:Glycine receptor subunit beta [Dirofilaria immitis]